MDSVWSNLARVRSEWTPTPIFAEVMMRLLILVMFIIAEFIVAEQHVIQPEDLWKYRFPHKESQVPFGHLLLIMLGTILVVLYSFGSILYRREYKGVGDFGQGMLGVTYSILLTSLITNVIKSLVGRPRPNYLIRCYGRQNYLRVTDASQPCISSNDWAGDLRKSFPSGHTSIVFSAFVFLSFYIAGKLNAFNAKGRGVMWRSMVPLIPVGFATWVGITRYVDYHHHYDDVIVGGLLGTIIAYLSYRQYYPSLGNENSQYPSAWIKLGVLAEEVRHSNSKPIHKLYFHNRQRGKNDLGTHGHFRREAEEKVLSEPLIASASQSSGTRGVASLQSLTHTNSTLNMDVHINRAPRLPSYIINNPDLSAISKASIAFYWSEDDLDANGQPLATPEDIENMRLEFLAALDDLERRNLEIDSNGNVE